MISDIRLQHFRSYSDGSFEFGDGVNIIVGPNGSGKTNLLESVLLLCRGNSYRANDKDLIAHNQPWARVDSHVNDQLRAVKLHMLGDTLKKEYVLGGEQVKRLTHAKTLPVVIFEPNHMQLLTESPELRRNFIDGVIEQTIPLYADIRSRYKRTLAQRNSLLKKPNVTADKMFIWNVRLSEFAAQIVEHRKAFIQNNDALLGDLYGTLADKDAVVQLQYVSTIEAADYASTMLKGLEDRLDKDKERGFTTIGPHRDDVLPLLNGYALSVAASRGETRTMLLALKLLELKAVEEARGVKPILLLDDVFSELDGARRQALTSHLKDHQTFITTTDADVVIQHFLDDCVIIPLGG